MTSISRRTVVGGGLAAALAGVAVGSAEPSEAAVAPLSFSAGEATVTGARTKGSTVTGHLQLFTDGVASGVLRASSIVSSSVHTGDLSTQVLELATGTLVGIGIAHARTLEGTFAIVGGTGAYTGARGSYTLSAPALHITLVP